MTAPADPPEAVVLPLARGGHLVLDRCRVMGILNATPDSFSDGGELEEAGAVEERVKAMLDAGVDVLDVGGESTRPGHEPVPADEEARRVVPVIHAIRRFDASVPVSIDTQKAPVARAALDAGADLVNDVSGLRDPNMASVVQEAGCAVVLMRNADLDGDIVTACRDELAVILDRAEAAGIPRDRTVLDPGLGFGKRPGPVVADNLALIDGVWGYALGRPVLIGASRKRFVGRWAGVEAPKDRVGPSVELAVRAARAGASLVRVHDVAETVAALRHHGL